MAIPDGTTWAAGLRHHVARGGPIPLSPYPTQSHTPPRNGALGKWSGSATSHLAAPFWQSARCGGRIWAGGSCFAPSAGCYNFSITATHSEGFDGSIHP